LGAPLRFTGIPGIVPVLKAYSGFRIARPASMPSMRCAITFWWSTTPPRD
jgi:hypothetical protein